MRHNVKNQVVIKFLVLKYLAISTEEVGRGLGVRALGRKIIYTVLRFLPFHRQHLSSTKYILYTYVFVHMYITMVNDRVIY